jgi:hypothetical protein
MLDKLKGFFSSEDATSEMNLLVYGAGSAAAILWLTWWFGRGPRDGNLVAAFAAFLTAITSGLVFKKGSNAVQPNAQPGTQDQEGAQK